MKRLVFCLILVAAFAMNASATTGAFTEPLTGAILSVDLNGGRSDYTRPTEGWNGSTTAGEFNADAYGVVWSPWAGPDWSGGDNGQLPQNSEGVGQDTVSISKTFTFNGTPASPEKIDDKVGTTPIDPPITVTISADGNLSSYKANWPISSRDRDGADTSDGYMFRDLIFGYKSGSNTQGTNYLKVEFSGLTVGAEYMVALYAHDKTSASPDNSVTWTATPPPHQAGYTDAGGFLAPDDVQTITWGSGTDLRAPVVFTLTADGDGKVTVWGFGGDGITGHSDSGNTYLNGFQLVPVPEEANNVHNITDDLWYATLNEALEDANDKDIIVVYPGTYYESIDMRDYNCSDEDITITSIDPDDWNVVNATIIDGNGADNTFVFGCSALEFHFIGLTVTGGTNGIYCMNGYPQINNCVIRNNSIGVDVFDAVPSIYNCIIKDNTNEGIAVGSASLQVKNCIIRGNNTAVEVDAYTGPVVHNCTITNNTSYGIKRVSPDCSVSVRNCILWNNGDELYDCSAAYSCIKGAFDANDPNYVGSIGDDPCFADADSNDFHLLSISPCIDTGNNSSVLPTDLDGFARIVDGDCDGSDIVDMGAYELSYVSIGDFDNQCDVDFQDFAVMAAAWLTEKGQGDYSPVCDIGTPSDGKIDMLDLDVFVENWLWSAGI